MLRGAGSAKSGWIGAGAAALVLSCVVGWYVFRVRELCRGELIYALDDPYIHLAIARQLVQHGTWGVSAHQFASASSSPAWTLLLAAATALFGVHAETAFVLAWLTGVLVCASAAYALRGSSQLVRYLAPLAIVSVVPVHVLVLTGMEHLLQTALTLLLAVRVLDALEEDRDTAGTALLAAALVATRFDSLCVVAAAVGLFAAAGRLARAGGLLLAGLAPIVAFALFSIVNGGPWLPSSVLAKATVLLGADPGAVLLHARNNLTLNFAQAPHVPVMVTAVFGLLFVMGRAQSGVSRGARALQLTAASILLHAMFARTGWFYRYEAYLIALAALAAVHAWESLVWNTRTVRIGAAVCLGLLPVALVPRAWEATRSVIAACRSIYAQQRQMAGFAATHYPGQAIVANDIGALAFFGDHEIVDVLGLATWPVLREKRRPGGNPSKVVLQLAERAHAQLAITYGREGPPWIRVASWTDPNPGSAAEQTVFFSAPTPAAAAELRARLRRFQPQLPGWVDTQYY